MKSFPFLNFYFYILSDNVLSINVKKLYNIETDLSIERNLGVVNDLDYGDFYRFKKLKNDPDFFMYDIENSDGTIHSFLIADDDQVDTIKYALGKCGVSFRFYDITREFLMGVIQVPLEEFEEYYDRNIDKDIILDKINLYGMRSLSERDFEILRS